MKDETIGFNLTKGEIELLREHYRDEIYQTIRDFDEDLTYKTIGDVEDLIHELVRLIGNYNRYNFE